MLYFNHECYPMISAPMNDVRSCYVYGGSDGRLVLVVYAHELLHTKTAKGWSLLYLMRVGSVWMRGGLKNRFSGDCF